MFRAMLWKEVREQAAILIALLVLGSGVIATATALGSSTGAEGGVGEFRAYTNAGRLAVLSLAVAAGVVVGGTLFAGEKENGTLACLESLPATRWRLWWGKLAAGVVMAFAAGIVLLTMGTVIGALGGNSPLVWLMWGMVLVFVAFGWGAFGSTLAESTLAACATGLVCAVLLGTPVFVVVAGLLRWMIGADYGRFQGTRLNGFWLEVPALVAMYSVAIFPLLLAGWIFSAPDRARLARTGTVSGKAAQPIVRRAAGSNVLAGLKALLWLTNRQWFVASAIGFGLTLLAGISLLHEDVHLVLFWPVVTTLAGVFGGTLAWADEQSKETFKFWGERRLPLGRLWVMKVTTSFVQTIGWTLLAFAPSLIRQLMAERDTPFLPSTIRSGVLVTREGWSILNFLLIWPVYGFAFGHLAGLLFRKTIVALGVGMLTAAPVAALWLPSLLTGGVHGWQLWPVPLAVLLSTRLILRPWTADRLGRVQPLSLLAGVGTACVAWLAFGLYYRSSEVPIVAEIDDDLRFAETVPQLDSEDGGRMFRQTTAAFRALVSDDYGAPPGGRPFAEGAPGRVTRNVLYAVQRDRWRVEDLRPLGEWLSSPDMEVIVKTLKEAASKPLGPLENPRGMVSTSLFFREAQELYPIVSMLLTRGLWKQLQGDSQEFAACLDAALAATRNARTMQPNLIHRTAYAPERLAFDAVDVWLQRAGVKPDLVRGVLAVLQKHERLCPRDLNQAFLTDRMVDRNRLNGISQWAQAQLESDIGQFWRSNATESLKQKANAEAELLSFSLAVPWERERYRRILGLNNAGGDGTSLMSGWLAPHFGPVPFSSAKLDHGSQALLVVSMTQLRLRLFALERGRPATALEELVPAYAATVPLDPYDDKPLRYRVSAGDRIRMGLKPDPWQQNPQGFPPLPVTGEERLGLSIALGGLASLDRPLPLAPGIGADGVPEIDLDVVAAAAGGLAQSALEPLDATPQPFGATPGAPGGPAQFRVAAGKSLSEEYVWREVEAGDGIVWSIGPDWRDDQGLVNIEASGGDYGSGDFIRVVPKKKPSP